MSATIAPTVFVTYEIFGHSDQTEGRGGLKSLVATVATIERFLELVNHPGFVREHGFYDRPEFKVNEVIRTVTDTHDVTVESTPIWGYRARGDDYGFLDRRDDPEADPEYANYVRLAHKFGKSI